MDHGKLTEVFLELIRRASTALPPDVEEAMKRGIAAEGEGSSAA